MDVAATTRTETPDAYRGPVRILTYHSLDDSGSVISVSPDAFRRQMESLHEWGYTGIALGQLVDAWEGKAPLPARPVVLTFDDAFGNVADEAAPVLTRLGFRATLFAVADYCGGRNDWPTQPASVPRLPLLSWAALRDLAGRGFEVGAHTLTHPPLSALPPDEVAREVVTCRAVLQDRLGTAVDTFAYPYGLSGRPVQAVAAGHYRAACGVRLGPARPSAARFDLPRVDVYYLRHPRVFRLFPSRAGSVYLGLRAFGRTCRALARRGAVPQAPPGSHP